MALNYKTYYAIPHLPTYADAKKHYDSIKPIRRDPHGTRPVGRRDQKWFHIWMDKDDVHVGYGWTPEHRHTLVSYQPGGTITLHKRNLWNSASDNERRERLLGTTVCTHQYDAWVKCAWYDEGERKTGYLPLRCNGKRGRDAPEQRSVFTRDSDGTLVFINYQYPVVHKPNNVRLKAALEPFRPLLQYADALRRLQGGERLSFEESTKIEMFGSHTYKRYDGVEVTTASGPHSMDWGDKAEERRKQFTEWAMSSDHEDMLRAVMTLDYTARPTSAGPRYMTDYLKYRLIRDNPRDLLEAHTHKDGRLVTDRYKRYLWW